MKISGIGFIYMITSPTGRIYVGSTEDIDYRWYRYKRLDCKGQVKLYNSFKKYGVDNHIFEIIWAGDVNDMLKYECMIGLGFNVLDQRKGLNCKLPKINDIWSCVSEETRLKMSNSAKIKIFSISHRINIGNKSKKAIVQYDLNMNFIKEWECVKYASKELNIDHSCIIKCCKGKYKTIGGFKWKYK